LKFGGRLLQTFERHLVGTQRTRFRIDWSSRAQKNNRNNPNAPPFGNIIDNRSSVGKLHADIAALPPVSSGPRNCLNNSAISQGEILRPHDK
jgi:hypothetical protein